MRLVERLVLPAIIGLFTCLFGQQPIAIGPDNTAGIGPGVANFFDWYTAAPSGGCVAGANGACVGTAMQGDTYFWTAWLPGASGLPVTSGLPVVGTANDDTVPGCSSSNIAVLQLDRFSWSAPTASHITTVNCMNSYSADETSAGTGWYWGLYSGDPNVSVGNGSWKSRAPFSKNGLLYLPVERQIHAGGPAIHDATYIVSPDSGKHWCNPYSLYHGTTPGTCDSSNWKADGDAPACGATAIHGACANAAYLDSTHSSFMWKLLSYGTEAWSVVNFGTQDGQSYPAGAGVSDGCDPTSYTCFLLLSGAFTGGTLARVPNASIMDISAWRYYTCPTITLNTHCPGSDAGNWTATLANATPVVFQTYSGSNINNWGTPFQQSSAITYIPQFKSYLLTGQGIKFARATSLMGPWNNVVVNEMVAGPKGNFPAVVPAIPYNVLSTAPPHVQVTISTNNYSGGEGSPQFTMYDLVLGRQMSGEAFQSNNSRWFTEGAGYQFSDGHIPGSFPRNGLVWSFDFLDQGANSGVTNWPFFVDRGNYSAVIVSCAGGTFWAPQACGSMNPGRGTSMNNYGISTSDPGYNGHFNTFAAGTSISTPISAPSAMLGNGSYSVVGVYRYEGDSPYRKAGIWSGGSATTLNLLHGRMYLDHGAYDYATSFTFPNTSNWYFVAVTIQAQTGGCGASCVPTAKVWVGGATTPGILADVNSGVSGGSTATPNVGAGPFLVGVNTNNSGQDSPVMTYATVMVYGRSLTQAEVGFMYRSMKAKMTARGVTIQ